VCHVSVSTYFYKWESSLHWCKEQHRITRLLRAFNPSFAYGKVGTLWVQRLASLPCFAHIGGIVESLICDTR